MEVLRDWIEGREIGQQEMRTRIPLIQSFVLFLIAQVAETHYATQTKQEHPGRD
jgi:hypothetical protein